MTLPCGRREDVEHMATILRDEFDPSELWPGSREEWRVFAERVLEKFYGKKQEVSGD